MKTLIDKIAADRAAEAAAVERARANMEADRDSMLAKRKAMAGKTPTREYLEKNYHELLDLDPDAIGIAVEDDPVLSALEVKERLDALATLYEIHFERHPLGRTEFFDAEEMTGQELFFWCEYYENRWSLQDGGLKKGAKLDAEKVCQMIEAASAITSTREPTPKIKPPEPKKRKAVTLNDAAKICGVSVPTIRNWEKGDYTPEGWPGRDDIVKLGLFAKGRESTNFFKQRVGKAIRYGSMDNVSHRVPNGGRL